MRWAITGAVLVMTALKNAGKGMLCCIFVCARESERKAERECERVYVGRSNVYNTHTHTHAHTHIYM